MNNTKFWGADPKGLPISNNNLNNLNLEKNNMIVKDATKFKSSNGKGNIVKGVGKAGAILLIPLLLLLVAFYIFLARPAISLYNTARVLKADAYEVGYSLQSRDLVSLEKALSKTETDLNNVKNTREKTFGWAKSMSLFKLNEFYSDSDRFINAGFYAVDALREVSKVVTPFADAAGLKISEDQAVPQTEGLMEAFQTWVSLMPEVAGQMDGVIEKVSKIGEELEPINVEKYPEKIGKVAVRSNIEFIKNNLSKADDYAPDLKQALTLFPRALGVGTTVKRYMVIMQNDKELRPTGGFMTNYATFKIQDGLLQSDFTSKDMYSIDIALESIDATYDFPDAPAAYAKYLKVEHWYSRDTNSSPDFRTSMLQFLNFYNLASRVNPYEIKPVDGIIAIDTQVIEELLEATGPVTVNGVTYTKDNVVLELERIASLELKEQVNRKKVLGDLMEAMLINVFESDKNLWPELINTGVDLAVRKHIQAYFPNDVDIQALVEKYSFGGVLKEPDAGSDYSMVVSTNLGGDKTNWFVSKVVDHTIENVDGKWMHTVKISYEYKQPSDSYSAFVARFKDWVRVYAPVGSQFISVDGSEDGTLTDQESNKVWFSGYLELGPGEKKEMTFKYYLPSTYKFDKKYNLAIQKQGGIDTEKHIVSIGKSSKSVELYSDVTNVSLDF